MSRAVVRAALPTAGISTARAASNIRWCAVGWCVPGARRARPWRPSRRGPRSSAIPKRQSPTSPCVGAAASCARLGTKSAKIIAAANVYTIKTWGPDRVVGFSPIPAMSMVSYASGARYLSLIGGTLLSFYDWYCDLPPSSPQTWGEQTDVPESADWYNSSYIIAWGSNVPQTRTPDAHFFVEARYNGTK